MVSNHLAASHVDWLDVALEEYRSLRADARAALGRQRAILVCGLLALAVAIALGLIADDGSIESTTALVAGAPLITLLVAAFWADEHDRLARTESRLLRLERSINARFPLDPPPLRWQPRGSDEESAARMRATYRLAVIVLLAIATGAAAVGVVGFLEEHSGTFAAIAVVVIPAAILTGTASLAVRVGLWIFRALDLRHVAEAGARLVVDDPQATRNLAARDRFLSDYEVYTPEQLFGGDRVAAAERADRLLFERRAFALDRGGETLFPRFQFDDERRPLPAIVKVLGAVGEDDPLGRWELALWLTTPSPYLEGGRPVDLLRSEPERVAHAAHEEFRPVVS
ncbi:MAG: hypothetical protein V7607_2559 [Solirubrobacteraceae bacterium]